MVAGECMLQPVFIAGPSGRLFALHCVSTAGTDPRRTVLYIPPFAEEMNRSRRMAALQARAFASIGISTLLLDLFGTGDSEGNFGAARMPLWLEDIAAAADWIERQGHVVFCLWGLRLGALIAAAAAARPPARFRRLLLWQPATDGKALLTQFLRIRVATAMAEGGRVEKTEDLRAQLAGGNSIEIGGYELAPELAQAIEAMRLEHFGLAAETRAHWLDLAAEAGDRLLPAGERVAEMWRNAGVSVSAATVAGDPFWSLQETTLVPALLAATTEMLSHA